MTTNKIIKYTWGILVAAGLMATISSCKKYLEVDPVSSFGPDYVFSNTGNVFFESSPIHFFTICQPTN